MHYHPQIDVQLAIGAFLTPKRVQIPFYTNLDTLNVSGTCIQMDIHLDTFKKILDTLKKKIAMYPKSICHLKTLPNDKLDFRNLRYDAIDI